MNESDEYVGRLIVGCIITVIAVIVVALTVTNIWGAVQQSKDFETCLERGGSWVVDRGDADYYNDDRELCQLPDVAPAGGAE